MAQVGKVPVSRLIHAVGDEGPVKKNRDEYRKAKELEEARKAGSEAAAVDEDGKDINPHIPQYISDAPWYLDPKGPTLKHQRQQEEKIKKYSNITEWYNRGVDTKKIATKYRKGACENCGAMTHKKKDCLERPRKIGAKYTGANFAPDEFSQPTLSHDFEMKRDRWNGYDPREYKEVIDEHKKLEEARKEVRKASMAEKKPPEEDDGETSSDEEDEDKYVDDMDMVGTKVDASERYTVRNLRIREDTAKYLRNLDPNSAHYDPKTRSMRKNPYEGTGKNADEVDYAGDNFIRITGATVDHAKSTMFAWEAARKGLDVHMLAEPTKLEALKSEFEKKKTEFKTDVNQSILDKYGGQEHLEAQPRELIFAQTEDYVEYSRHGKLLKGVESNVVRSRYEEDKLIQNHTMVWGSWWFEGKWGYKCCHSTTKNSYCTGESGKKVNEATSCLSMPPPSTKEEDNEEEEEEQQKTLVEIHNERSKTEKKSKKKKSKKKKKKNKKAESSSSSSSSSSSDDSEDEEEIRKRKVAEAVAKLEAENARHDRLMAMDERKRPYNSMVDSKAPTEEEMEAYHLKRQRSDDPMAAFLGK